MHVCVDGMPRQSRQPAPVPCHPQPCRGPVYGQSGPPTMPVPYMPTVNVPTAPPAPRLPIRPCRTLGQCQPGISLLCVSHLLYRHIITTLPHSPLRGSASTDGGPASPLQCRVSPGPRTSRPRWASTTWRATARTVVAAGTTACGRGLGWGFRGGEAPGEGRTGAAGSRGSKKGTAETGAGAAGPAEPPVQQGLGRPRPPRPLIRAAQLREGGCVQPPQPSQPPPPPGAGGGREAAVQSSRAAAAGRGRGRVRGAHAGESCGCPEAGAAGERAGEGVAESWAEQAWEEQAEEKGGSWGDGEEGQDCEGAGYRMGKGIGRRDPTGRDTTGSSHQGYRY